MTASDRLHDSTRIALFRELASSYRHIRQEVSNAGVGKKVSQDLYVHVSALTGDAHTWVHAVARVADAEAFNIVKFRMGALRRLSLLHYPTFDDNGFPALATSYLVAFDNYKTKRTDYYKRPNPPILHRKEAFVRRDYPLFEAFATLTRKAEKAGLFAEPRKIGTRKAWNNLLVSRGLRVVGNDLVPIQSGPRETDNHTAPTRRLDLTKSNG